MLAAVTLSILAMSAIIAVGYLAASGGFAWLTERRYPGFYVGRAKQIRSEVRWSLASAFIYGVPAGALAWGWQAHGWTRIYSDLSAYPWWWVPASAALFLLIHDAWFYWTHRWMHRPAIFRRMHSVHHASRNSTASAAMRFHPYESLTGAVLIPTLVLLIPIHCGALLAVLTVMTIMGVTNHMGWEVFPRQFVNGPLGKWVITWSHHQRHHEKYMCNFGLYFRFWDKLCGTDLGSGSLATARQRGPS